GARDVHRGHAEKLAIADCSARQAEAGYHDRSGPRRRERKAATGFWFGLMKDARVQVVAPPIASVRRQSNLSDYIALTKPRLNLLVVLTSAAGYYLGAVSSINLWQMAQAVVGTALVAGGAAVLNQVYERDTDALMRRTLRRPLPDHRVTAGDATIFGLALAPARLRLLALVANVLAEPR